MRLTVILLSKQGFLLSKLLNFQFILVFRGKYGPNKIMDAMVLRKICIKLISDSSAIFL